MLAIGEDRDPRVIVESAAVVADRRILPQRVDIGHLDRRVERRASVQRPSDEDRGLGRRNAARTEGRTNLPGHKDLAIRAEHEYRTLLQRPGVATIGNGIRLFGPRDNRARPGIPAVLGSPDLNLAKAILRQAAQDLEIGERDHRVVGVIRVGRDRLLVVEVVRAIRRIEDSNVVPGKIGTVEGPTVDAYTQVSTCVAIDGQVRVEEGLPIRADGEPRVAAGEDRDAHRTEPAGWVWRPSVGPSRSAISRESVSGESIRHLGSTGGAERRPAETLGIVPACHHVMAVRGNGDRCLTSPQKARRSRRLPRVYPHVGTDRTRILTSLIGGVPGGSALRAIRVSTPEPMSHRRRMPYAKTRASRGTRSTQRSPRLQSARS